MSQPLGHKVFVLTLARYSSIRSGTGQALYRPENTKLLHLANRRGHEAQTTILKRWGPQGSVYLTVAGGLAVCNNICTNSVRLQREEVYFEVVLKQDLGIQKSRIFHPMLFTFQMQRMKDKLYQRREIYNVCCL